MSCDPYTIFITNNKVDESEIFTIFNREIIKAMDEPPCRPDYYPEYIFVKKNPNNTIYPCGEIPRPYYMFFESLSLNGITSSKHGYVVKYGDHMFHRQKFPLYDAEARIYYDLHMNERKGIDSVEEWIGVGDADPPYDALYEFFAYIQKNNNELHLFVDRVHVDDELNERYIQKHKNGCNLT